MAQHRGSGCRCSGAGPLNCAASHVHRRRGRCPARLAWSVADRVRGQDGTVGGRAVGAAQCPSAPRRWRSWRRRCSRCWFSLPSSLRSRSPGSNGTS